MLDLFLARAQSQRGYALGPGTPMPAALAHLDLLDGGEPSHAAVLLFGTKPQRFLPSSEIKCMRFHGKEVRKPIPSYQIFKGTVFELVDRAVDFVLSKLAAMSRLQRYRLTENGRAWLATHGQPGGKDAK